MRTWNLDVRLANSEELGQISEWITDPAIYSDAFMLPSKPDPALINDSVLMISVHQNLELAKVRFWAVRDAADALVGFAVDYPWDAEHPDQREIDMALYGSGNSPRRPAYVYSLVTHQLFRDFGVSEVIARVRVGAGGKGHTRLFSFVGAEASTTHLDINPTSGRPEGRVYYRCTPRNFYASRGGLGAREAG